MRELRQKLKEEKARQIEQKIKNLHQLTSKPKKCTEQFKIYIKQETTANFMQQKRTDNKWGKNNRNFSTLFYKNVHTNNSTDTRTNTNTNIWTFYIYKNIWSITET